MSPHAEGKKGTHDTDVIYMMETKTEGGEKTHKLCLKAEWHYKELEGTTPMWTTEDRCLHRLTNPSPKHALAQVHERSQ